MVQQAMYGIHAGMSTFKWKTIRYLQLTRMTSE